MRYFEVFDVACLSRWPAGRGQQGMCHSSLPCTAWCSVFLLELMPIASVLARLFSHEVFDGV